MLLLYFGRSTAFSRTITRRLSVMPLRRNWFEALFGVVEPQEYKCAQDLFDIKKAPHGVNLTSTANGRSYQAGLFSTPSVAELQRDLEPIKQQQLQGSLQLEHIVIGDVLLEHHKPEYRLATFQAASQFNCLEFSHPNAVPEEGVTQYAYDFTQGPACSIACGPGTVYRNYFASVGHQVGQTRHCQLNNLDNALLALGNGPDNKYFEVRNGYTHTSNAQLEAFNQHYPDQTLIDEAMRQLKIGVQQDTQVTFSARETVHDDPNQLVTQCYCSAISCGYTFGSLEAWKPLALGVLRAGYEATLWIALRNAHRHHQADASQTVLLTLVGGGVFRNEKAWIADAIGRACAIFADNSLTVKVCHYRRVDQDFVDMVASAFEQWKSQI
eukprot:TRINITY_DN11193_c0_g1_i1.p1 TRINITY_DN11193_c0_g1~~TRINITY_DN11193_c0_g1_i1.p1  ORF type:complete len:383 (+),score=49.80 TRINITY_DN11193_c0_g1_i1:1745-2893(+)